MAYFALLWKARTIEIYRQNYESEKINSILMSKTSIPKQSLTQRWRHYRYDTQKRISRTFRRWYPEGSSISNLFLYLKTDQTFPNFVLKSILGFVGGIVLTYLCFMFFVFQLSISLMHATIMSSIIGVLLTLGLAFSYRIRCLVFLLIPQFFSRMGRYTLTCYALVLILTGPATNTLKNSEVLSESMACGQEQIKTSVSHIKTLMARPLNSLKYSMPKMVDKLRRIAAKMKRVILKVNRLILSISQVINTGYLWLNNLATSCNAKLGTPYLRCMHAVRNGVRMCKSIFGSNASGLCDVEKVLKDTCSKYNRDMISVFFEHLNGNPVRVIKKRLKNFTERIKHMFFMQVHVHHSYSFSSNTTRTASQVAAGIVTEIRKRADPLLTWLSWSSYVTSFFLLLIIFRAKNYQHMFETRSRFDNSYITKDIRILDLKRLREKRETILPLNRREQAKYVTTTSFRLVASEKAYLNRSVVFMAITTFKLLIHMIADYSLYWVLITIRHHGRLQTPVQIDAPNTGILVSGSGLTSDLLKSIVTSLGVLLESPVLSPVSCLPNPAHPDFKRYTQIGVLIFLLWFFSMFEPYGLRLRHVVMGHYQPDRAKTRAVWLYNHILRARAGFMKLARRKLHRTYKYRSEEKLTIHQWLLDHIPFCWLRILLGITTVEPHCLLCGTVYFKTKPDTQLIRCKSLDCPGIYCDSCFTDIGELCTICLSPDDYGDLSDVSLEKGSSEDSEDSDESDDDSELRKLYKTPNLSICEEGETPKRFPKRNNRNIFSRNKRDCSDKIPLISKSNYKSDAPINDEIPTYVFKSTMKKAIIIRRKTKCDNKSHNKFYKYLGNHNDHGLKEKFWKSIKDNNSVPHFANVTKVYNDFMFPNQNKKQIVNNTKQKVNQMFNKRITINQKKTNRRLNTKHTKNLKASNYSRRPLKASNLMPNIAQCRFYRITLASNSISIDKTFKNNKVVTAIKEYYKPTCKCKMKRKGRLSTDFARTSKRSPIKYHPKQIGKKVFVNSILTFSCCSNNDHAGTLDSRNDKNKDSKINNKESYLKERIKARVASCYGFEKLSALFCDYWRNIVVCSRSKSQNSNISEINDTTITKERKDHKGRKKKSSKYEVFTSIASDDSRFKSDEIRNEENRKYRVSVFLSDQDWIKRQWNNIGTKMKTELSLAWNDISDAVAEMKSFQTKKKVDEKAIESETIDIDVANKLKEEIHLNMHSQSIAVTEPATVQDICENYGCDLITVTSSNISMDKILKCLRNFIGRQTNNNTESVPQSRFCSPNNNQTNQTKELCKPITNKNQTKELLCKPITNDAVCQRGQACDGDVSMSSGIRQEFRRRKAVTEPEVLKEKNVDFNSSCTPNQAPSRVSCKPCQDICAEQPLETKCCLKPSKVDRFLTFLKSLLCRSCCWCAELRKKIGITEDCSQCESSDKTLCPCLQTRTKKNVCCCSPVPKTICYIKQVCCCKDAKIGTSHKETRNALTCTEFLKKDICHVSTNTENKKDVAIHVAFGDQTDNYDAGCKFSKQTSLNYYLKDKKEDNVDCISCTPKQINQSTRNKIQNKIFEYLSSGISSAPISSSSETAIKSTCYTTKVQLGERQQCRRSELDHKLVQTIQCRTLRNASTNTKDWWSPIVDRKLEKKEKAVVIKMRWKKDNVADTEKNVTFESRTEIIPRFPSDHANDVLSPYQYLLQSQKYYNELFAMKNYPARTSTFQQRYFIGHSQTSRQSVGSRKPNRKTPKTKRLVECYSPKKQFIRKQPIYEWVQGGEYWTNARKKYNRSSSKSNSLKPLRRNND